MKCILVLFLIEHHDKKLISFLQKMSYDGDLVYYPQHVAVYWIFDTNKLS
ncbi:hypothetical protein [Capnocytophaga cynodegmi]|nr:hypothetical protein [Capnocytophaga cynodegmi]